MKVLYIAAECKPFAKMGGVGDVAGELPPALKKQGVDIEVVIPSYGSIKPEIVKKHVKKKNLYRYDVPFAVPGKPDNVEAVAVHRGRLEGVPVFFIENETYFEGTSPDNPNLRYDRPYVTSDDVPFKDDIIRFSFFSEACLELIRKRKPDIVHINDWVLGYLFGRMKMEGLTPKRVLTIHNIGYQANIWKASIQGWHIQKLQFDPGVGPLFNDPNGNDVNAMRLGLELADRVNAVSPTYSREMIQPENAGAFFEGGKGLDAITRRVASEDRLVGILNGFVYKHEPTGEAFEEILVKKAEARKQLAQAFADPDALLLGFVGRAVEQKFKLLTEPLEGRPILDHILDLEGVNVAILGTGVPEYESFIGNVATRHFDGPLTYLQFLQMPRRKNYSFTIAFDREMAKLISLGSDVFLMPSLFEPCGITQMESMANATPPLVRWTGGLVDTVIPHYEDGGTGFGFDGTSREEVLWSLLGIVKTARDLYAHNKEAFRALQQNGFNTRFTWDASAKEYVETLYQPVL